MYKYMEFTDMPTHLQDFVLVKYYKNKQREREKYINYDGVILDESDDSTYISIPLHLFLINHPCIMETDEWDDGIFNSCWKEFLKCKDQHLIQWVNFYYIGDRCDQVDFIYDKNPHILEDELKKVEEVIKYLSN